MAVMLKGGKVLLTADGKVATGADCCCGGGICCFVGNPNCYPVPGDDYESPCKCKEAGGKFRSGNCDSSACGCCSFEAFDGSGRRFSKLTRYYQITIAAEPCCPGHTLYKHTDCWASGVYTADPDTCIVTSEETAGGTKVDCADGVIDCPGFAGFPAHSWDTSTATERTYDHVQPACSFDGNDYGTITIHAVDTLSDECPGACCHYNDEYEKVICDVMLQEDCQALETYVKFWGGGTDCGFIASCVKTTIRVFGSLHSACENTVDFSFDESADDQHSIICDSTRPGRTILSVSSHDGSKGCQCRGTLGLCSSLVQAVVNTALVGTTLTVTAIETCASCLQEIQCSNGYESFAILSMDVGGCQIIPGTSPFPPITISGPGTYTFSATFTVHDSQACQCRPGGGADFTTGTVTLEVTVVIE